MSTFSFPGWRVRRAFQDDIDELVRFRIELHDHLRRANKLLLQMSERGRENLADRYEQMLSDAWTCILVAEDTGNSKLFGMGIARASVLADFEPARVGRLDDVWVEPAHRRRGAAREILRAAVRFFHELDIEVVDLSYTIGNTEAESVWPALGFSPILTVATARVYDLEARLNEK